MPRPAVLAALLLTAAAPALPGFNAAVTPPAISQPAAASQPAAVAPPVAPPVAPTLAAPTLAAPTLAAPTLAAPTLAPPHTAADFLALAAQSVAARQARPALRALGAAETRLLSRSVPLFQTHQTDNATPVRLIEQARQAIRANDFPTAATLIARATPLLAPHPNGRPTPSP